jgi:hypothetical protein
MFCAPEHVFGGTKGIRSLFHVMRSLTRFQRYRGCRVPFSCFACPNSFSVVPRPSGPVFMFSYPGHVFGRIEGVGSLFHVLHSRTRFWRCRGRPIPFSCLPLPGMFLALPRASGPFFMFCAPGIIFGGIEGVRSHFHVLRFRTHFWRYRGHQIPFSCFALLDSFSAVRRPSSPVFIFCAPRIVFGCAECVGSRFHVLRARTHFGWYRGRRVPFSCFARTNYFSAVRRASCLVFMFCAPELIFGGAECIGSRFNVLRV